MNTALLLVDVQNDFFPGGPVATPGGDGIVEPCNRLIDMFRRHSLPIAATRDWHPPNHCSFKEQGGQWPPHCVRDTEGAAFHSGIRLPEDALVVSKAQEPDQEAYSGFQGTDLARLLRERDVSALVVGGLATDYCVKNTVLDALKERFHVSVVREAVSGVDAEPGDSEKAIREMEDKCGRMVSIEGFSL